MFFIKMCLLACRNEEARWNDKQERCIRNAYVKAWLCYWLRWLYWNCYLSPCTFAHVQLKVIYVASAQLVREIKLMSFSAIDFLLMNFARNFVALKRVWRSKWQHKSCSCLLESQLCKILPTNCSLCGPHSAVKQFLKRLHVNTLNKSISIALR